MTKGDQASARDSKEQSEAERKPRRFGRCAGNTSILARALPRTKRRNKMPDGTHHRAFYSGDVLLTRSFPFARPYSLATLAGLTVYLARLPSTACSLLE